MNACLNQTLARHRSPAARWRSIPRGIAAIVLILAPCLAGGAQAATEQPAALPDSDVSDAVVAELRSDAVIDADQIDVTTGEGIVTLTGTVDHILARERAVRRASLVLGVRGVVNRVTVEPLVFRGDDELATAVDRALFNDPATESYEVAVSATDGAVTLEGRVDSWAERSLCATVAKGVRGVRSITNDIRVSDDSSRRDTEIASEIEARLANDVRIDDALLGVEVHDGRVALTGAIGSLAEKNLAMAQAWVRGVRTVDVSGLDIRWWARDLMRRDDLLTGRDDAEIARAVDAALFYDPRVHSSNPEVAVADGVVTLSGEVADQRARLAAARDARNVVGVVRVIDALAVAPTASVGDVELADTVARALAEDPIVDPAAIDVSASAGTVVLDGRVASALQKYQAAWVAAGARGAVEVVNHLHHPAELQERLDDAELAAEVRDELFWSPFVSEGEVTVGVEAGVVTLTGTVETWTERAAAANNAREAGALDVVNRLHVAHDATPEPQLDDFDYGPIYEGPLFWN